MTSTYLFEFTAGDDYALEIDIKDSEGAALNLSDYIFQATLKLDPRTSDDTAPVKVDTAPLDPDAGKVVILFDHTQTRNLQPGKHFFDVQMVNTTTGNTTTFISGRVKVLMDVTRRHYLDGGI